MDFSEWPEFANAAGQPGAIVTTPDVVLALSRSAQRPSAPTAVEDDAYLTDWTGAHDAVITEKHVSIVAGAKTEYDHCDKCNASHDEPSRRTVACT